MRERPEGHDLLAIAVKTLREQVLPAVPEDKKYQVLMVLKALSVAELSLRADESQLIAERAVLESLLKVVSPTESPRPAVEHLEREFGRRLRRGTYDNDPKAQRVLWDLTVQRVRESAPRYLESEGVEAGGPAREQNRD